MRRTLPAGLLNALVAAPLIQPPRKALPSTEYPHGRQSAVPTHLRLARELIRVLSFLPASIAKNTLAPSAMSPKPAIAETLRLAMSSLPEMP